MKLYHHPLSGHAHRAHLFLSLAGIPHEIVPIDLSIKEQKSDWFLALNAFGEIPVLDDNGVIVADSTAIMIYAARRVGPSHWLPEDPTQEAEVQRWLAVAAGKIAFGPAAARIAVLFNRTVDMTELHSRSHAVLAVIDQVLSGCRWIAGTDQPTVADVGLYSYIARCPEGFVDRSAYTAITAWLERVEALPGFVPFVETPVGLSA
ncbi:glutathione S-transferase family protein [Novispirillum itersonii]|uniref:glutathione S-transferase family protein n=1 Tax=Novispirillum itersonii TaxID=189 RepID=UPI00037FB9E0|nr:glutathione S-transferase [Novispirillum itersonii]